MPSQDKKEIKITLELAKEKIEKINVQRLKAA
jgi:hypothetical protein